MTEIAVTCMQMARDIDAHRAEIAGAGLTLRLPVVPGQHLEGQPLIDALDGCEGVIAGDDKFTRAVLAALPRLRAIARWGSGTDGIDFAAAADHGVRVSNTPGQFGDEVADVAIGYVIMLARQLHTIDAAVRSGRWEKPAGRSLRGLTLGIVGLGDIGRAMARRGRVVGMDVLGNDPTPESRRAATEAGVATVELDELLASADVVSLHCPLTSATAGLIGERALNTMKPGTWLINTARGEIVDERALVVALESGRVAAAALDVFEREPLPPDSPLLAHPRVILGSHNASNTLEASARVHRRALDNLLRDLGIRPS